MERDLVLALARFPEIFINSSENLKPNTIADYTNILADKFILDATAGFRSMWFNKKHPNCLYIDQRPECEPDIVADHRNLTQIPDNQFKLIVYDPPHIIRSTIQSDTNVFRRFGVLRPDTWTSDIKKSSRLLPLVYIC